MQIIFEQNYAQLAKLIPNLKPAQNCLLQAKDQPDTLFMLKENLKDPVVSLSRYAFEGKSLLPQLEISILLLHGKKQARVLGSLNRFGELREIYLTKDGKTQVDESNMIALNVVLNNWLCELLSFRYQPAPLQWKHLPQEKEDQGYQFNGFVVFTQGIMNQLSAAEIALIFTDLKRFVTENNHSVDYLQVYQKGEQKVFCIDQLNKAMLEGDGYTPKEKEEYNYFTIMLAEEY